MDISILISLLPSELKHLIGQHLGLYFPFDLDSAKDIINQKNYIRYEEHALKRDNVEQFKIILGVLDHFSTQGMRISDIISIKKHIDCFTLLTVNFKAITCLKYLTENGYHRHCNAISCAINNDHIACLQYLIQNNYYIWDPDRKYLRAHNLIEF